MGYDVERFVGSINDGLLCCICRDVLEDPLQAPCEHAYCTSCIHAWLVHDQICPEDRQPLTQDQLHPIFRYMRNDLNQLRLRCRNRVAGCCDEVMLENLTRHEAACDFGRVTCPNVNCGIELERRVLDSHLLVCTHRTKTCPQGCGLTVLNSEVDSHNCVAELRLELELLRSEMIGKNEDQKHEMKLRLDSQRTHMVHKISEMQQQMDELKSQNDRLFHDVRLLSALERKRGQDMERLELEKKELLEVLKALKDEHELAKTNTCRITAL
ncbi:E3 ubiquitin-protein ligase NRDP1-like [Asterias rubens]|uniref:E3 ubiquitin-protein ligase NRDP1-like n=1 Tax=Asterias rubens TaxID=7604 RepID=UPI001455651B|nr:E3 ubiquitin-protein ligase NRDP1-like [Asterias rubens]